MCSCLDLELLDACREEFHRRLKVYHAWKLKNRKGKNPLVIDEKNDDHDEERAPKDILNNGKFHCTSMMMIIILSLLAPSISPVDGGSNKKGAQASNNAKKTSSGKASEQRYFRIPFLRPNERNREANGEQKKKGWWYAHFDGKHSLSLT